MDNYERLLTGAAPGENMPVSAAGGVPAVSSDETELTAVNTGLTVRDGENENSGNNREDDGIPFIEVEDAEDDGRRRTGAPRRTTVVIEIDANGVDGVTTDKNSRSRHSDRGQTEPKVVQWEKKLLDLGLKNDLINLHARKKLIPVYVHDPEALEDALASGKDFVIEPRPDGANGGDEKAELEFETDIPYNVLASEFNSGRLRSRLSEKKLADTEKELFRAARLSVEENGANTLFLTLGALKWEDDEKAVHYAPVVLIPVELVRKGANRVYAVRMRDEPQMNITLLEKLSHDFEIEVSGLDPLPEDPITESVDIEKVFSVLGTAVAHKGWKIINSAFIGSFSFSQFVMWNDLRNRRDEIISAPVVKSLIEGKLCWDAEAMKIGDVVPEDAVYLPLSADASQIYAIISACEGKTFVLHGPPGTGKSQTITSLIFNLIAEGKTVLFVAEKKAALEVVRNRLESVGIGEFCLALHSDKTKKRDLTSQLDRALGVVSAPEAGEYELKAAQTEKLRAQSAEYCRELHKIRKCGRSLYSLINEYELYKDAPDAPVFSPEETAGLDENAIKEREELLSELVLAGKQTGPLPGHPLDCVKGENYSLGIKRDLKEVLGKYAEALSGVSGPAAEISSALGLGEVTSFDDLRNTLSVADELMFWADMPRSWTETDDIDALFAELEELCAAEEKAAGLYSGLALVRKETFFALDGKKLAGRYAAEQEKGALKKLFSFNRFEKEMAEYAVPGSAQDIEADIKMLCEYQTARSEADIKLEKAAPFVKGFIKDGKTDTRALGELLEAAKTSDEILCRLTDSCRIRTKYRLASSLSKDISLFNEKCSALFTARDSASELIGMADVENGGSWTEAQLAACRSVYANADGLRDRMSFNRAAAAAEAAGLGKTVEFYKNGAIAESVIPAYKKALLISLITDAADSSPALSTFSGAVFGEKIEAFRKADAELMKLTRTAVFNKKAAKITSYLEDKNNSAGINKLKRLIKSGGRGRSIRSIMEDIPEVISELCPCMLMSPISAAQFLDPSREKFDVVVFDEASQLPTCKAAGVLARGKSAVIVGDPKQMPPTTFFAVNTSDTEDPETEDLESILDDCLALNMPETHLLWHYRSRHESLIAFSNSEFYENRLYTFPSVNDRERRVSLERVNGIFDRSSTRTNPVEAAAVVGEIKKRAASGELDGASLGVVTFNIAQQRLIEDMLSEACRADAELEKAVSGGEEPLFIKNLENVQGDERDIILFSVAYGPDSEGKFLMNFGPLNREGGWRRLNVAVTRARCEMKVFSSVDAEDIDITRASSEGVKALRDFLAYAAGRQLEVTASSGKPAAPRETGIAGALAAALEREGFETVLSIGHSGYKIDLGVIDPSDRDRYLLGILLDGESFAGAKTERDRAISQISVLEGLGWNIHRVWSGDWMENSENEIKKVVEKCVRLAAAGKQLQPVTY